MKRNILLLAVLLVAITSCSKKDHDLPANGSIIGEWKPTTVYQGTGGPTTWRAADNTNRHLVIASDSSYSYTNIETAAPGGYMGGRITMPNDSTITWYNASGSYTSKAVFTNKGNELTIWGLTCIEGCATMYERQVK